MTLCLFYLNLASYGFGVGEDWNGGERGEGGQPTEKPQQYAPRRFCWSPLDYVCPGSKDETYHTGDSCSTPFQTRVRLSLFYEARPVSRLV